MKILKSIIVSAITVFTAVGLAHSYSVSGDIRAGATPNAFVYQGRLERNGSPVSDTSSSKTTFYFALFNKAEGGSAGSGGSACLCKGTECSADEIAQLDAYATNTSVSRCLWYSGPVSTQVVSGVFSVSVEVPWQAFRYPTEKYLELNVSGQPLSPRTRIGSVPYALVAKKLEDNASVKVSSLSVAEDGNIYLNDGCIIFNNNGTTSSLCSAMTASAIGSVQGESVFFSAGTEIYFQNGNPLVRTMTIAENGKVGIGPGTNNPTNMLTVNGDIGLSGTIYGFNETTGNDSPIVIGSSLSVTNGIINDGAITINEDYISLKPLNADTGTQLYISKTGNVGIDTDNPQYALHVNGSIYAASGENGGIQAGNILVGDSDANHPEYSGAIIRGNNSDIYIQKDGSKHIGIGTTDTSFTNKLAVEGGIATDSMTVTGPANFAGSVVISGPSFTISNGIVNLPETHINGNLKVTGKIGTDDGDLAYLNNVNVFESTNTFKSIVTISSDVYSYGRMVVGAETEEMPFGNTDNYLVVNGNADDNSKADIYILGGSAANASLRFYHAENETARLTTNGMGNLNFVVAGSTVSELTSDSYTVNKNFKVADDTRTALYIKQSSVAINSASVNDEATLKVEGKMYVDSIRFKDGSIISKLDEIGNPTGLRSTGTIRIVSGEETAFYNKQGNTETKVMSVVNNMVGIGDVGVGGPKAALHVGGNMLIGNVDNPSSDPGTLTTSGSIYADENINASKIYTGGLERINSTGQIVSGEWHGNIIDVSHGGTGLSTIPNGIIKGHNNSITVGKVDLTTEVDNTLPIANGGTGNTEFATAGPIRYDSVNNKLVRGVINLADEVENQLSIANGGTGQNLNGKPGILRSYGTYIGTATVNLASGTDVEGILAIDNGGTGRSSYTEKGILVYNSGSIAQVNLAKGEVLMGDSDGVPSAGSITSADGTITVDTNTNKTIRLSIPQSVATGASPTFAGLKFVGDAWSDSENHMLLLNNDGTVGHTAELPTSVVTGILGVAKGGTGNGSDVLSHEGPIRLVMDGLTPKLATGTVNMATEVTGVLAMEHGGTGYNAYTAGDFLVATGTGTFKRMRLANGQVFIGDEGDMPVAALIAGTANQVVVETAPGSITLSLPQNINTGATPTFAGLTLTELTGFVKANGNNALTAQSAIHLDSSDVDGVLPLAHGGTGKNILVSETGLIRNYGNYISSTTVNLASNGAGGDVSGILGIDNGGTGRPSFPVGIVRYYEGTSLSTGAVRLASAYDEVEGILPISNGGTGVSAINTGIVHSNGSELTGSAVSLSTEVIGVLPVANGGTAHSSFTANAIIYAASASSLAELPLAKGEILMGDDSGVPAAGIVEGVVGTGIIVDTDTDKKIIVSAVQDINMTASPTFAGLSLTGLGNGFLISDSGGVITSTPALSMNYFTGILPVEHGGTGRDEAFFTTNSGPLYSYGTGDISTGSIHLDTEVSGVLPVEHGGTGTGTLTTHGIIYSAGSNLESVVLGSGQLLIGVAGGNPVAAGLTGDKGIVITPADGAITISVDQPIGLAQGSTPTFAGMTLTGYNGVLKATDGAVSATTVNLASDYDVSSVLPVANGGTGQDLNGKNGVLRSYGTYIGTGTVNLASVSDVGTSVLPVANGGTGVSSYDTSAGNVIKYNSEDKQFYTSKLNLDSDSDVSGILPVSRGGTGMSSVSANSVLMTGSSANVLSPVQLSAGQILMSNNTGTVIAGRIEGSNGISVSTDDAKLSISFDQNLTTSGTPTFSGLKLTGIGGAGLIHADAEGSLYTAVLSTADITGTVQVSSGGTGSTSFTPNGILYYSSADGGSVRSLALDNNRILARGSSSSPEGLYLTGELMSVLSVVYPGDTGGEAGKIILKLSNALAQTSTPTFAGLKLSDLAGTSGVIKVDGSGNLTTGALGVANGGTGLTSISENSVMVSNSGGNLEALSLASGKILIGGASGTPVAKAFTSGSQNGITVTTSGSNITIAADQDLGTEASPTFNTLGVTTLNAGNATVSGVVNSGTLNVTGAATMTTANVGKLVLKSQTKTVICGTSPTAGSMAYCTTGCTDAQRILIYNGSGWYTSGGTKICP